jgi:chromosomal replication initiator protein
MKIKHIQKATAKHYGVTVDEILSPRRSKHLTNPRHVAMYLSRVLTENSYPAIAREFKRRDHTTPLHAFKRISAVVKEDVGISAAVTAIIAELTKGKDDDGIN